MVAVRASVAVHDDQSALEAEIRRIEMRLGVGFEKIVEAADNGDDVSRWEEVWIQLLHEYEALHDRNAA